MFSVIEWKKPSVEMPEGQMPVLGVVQRRADVAIAGLLPPPQPVLVLIEYRPQNDEWVYQETADPIHRDLDVLYWAEEPSLPEGDEALLWLRGAGDEMNVGLLFSPAFQEESGVHRSGCHALMSLGNEADVLAQITSQVQPS